MATTGIVLNIQKFSLHDGPGIRTTVFLKGCPLRCPWCANPESQRRAPQPMRDAAACAGCGRCAAACTTGGTACDGCGRCAAACPVGAIEMTGAPRDAEDIVRECLRDRPFYEESGGGVTLSGGEPLAQPAFCEAILAPLRALGIHTALETTGYAPPAVVARLAPLVDLFLLDLKHHDSAAHEAATGVPLAPILDALRMLQTLGRDVLVRIPIIPGHNDAPADAAAYAALLRAQGITTAQLLPFHQLGEGKYDRLGLPYALRGVAPLDGAALAPYRAILEAAGIRCRA